MYTRTEGIEKKGKKRGIVVWILQSNRMCSPAFKLINVMANAYGSTK